MKIPEILPEESEVLKDALQCFGHKSQEDMMIEEMSELTKAILKCRRSCYCDIDALNNTIEEMVDVYIMLLQMYYYFCYDKKAKAYFGEMLHKKIARLEERVKNYD